MKIDENVRNLITNFNKAITQEIEDIKKMGWGKKITVINGDFLNSKADKFIYEFTITNPSLIPDDSPLELTYGNNITKGNIISINGLRILISLDKNIGDRIPLATLTINSYALLEKLNEKYNEVLQGKIDLNSDIAMKVFNYIPAKLGQTQFTTDKKLTDSQIRAISKSLGSEIFFIWGPPGTGKTYTLSKIVKILFEKGKTALIISNTNVAVDNAIGSTANDLRNNKDYLDGKVLRYGIPQDRDLFTNCQYLDIDYLVKVKSEKLTKELNKLRVKITKLDEVIKNVNVTLEVFQSEKEFKEAISVNKNAIKEFEQNEDKIKDMLAGKQKEEKLLQRRLAEKKTAGFLKRFFFESVESIKSKIFSSETEIENLQVELDTIKKEVNEVRIMNKHNTNELEKVKNFLKIYNLDASSKKQLTEEVRQFQKEMELFQQKETELLQKLQSIEEQLFLEAKILATTLTKCYVDKKMYGRKFDVVIVDESSMAPLPVLFFALGLAQEKALIFGDFRQLPPIAQGKNEISKKWLLTDIYEHTDITHNIDKGSGDPRVEMLMEQFRMHKTIAELVNDQVYNGKLLTKIKTGNKKEEEIKTTKSNPFPNSTVVICDTSSFSPWCSLTSTYSRFNLYSASLSVHLAKLALADGVKDVAILTPYAAQHRIINQVVLDEKLDKAIVVASVHKMQGREKELIILDLTEGYGSRRPSHLINGPHGSESMKLLNVAITRAKSKLVIVTDLSYLLPKLSSDSLLNKVLNVALKKFSTIDSKQIFEFIPQKARKEDYFINSKIDNKALFCREDVFYKLFKKDLAKAKRSVIIFTPYLTTFRFSLLDEDIRRLISEKIPVMILTKPIFEHDQRMSEEAKTVLDYLKRIGAKIIEKKEMHEKLCLIDEKIIWFGSLNIFSHKNTSELMVRQEGSGLGEELLKLFKVAKTAEEEAIKEKIEELNLGDCPMCGKRDSLRARKGSRGLFVSCNGWPRCKYTSDPNEKIIKLVYGEDYFKCKEHGETMQIKWSRKNRQKFLGCKHYPNCKITKPI